MFCRSSGIHNHQSMVFNVFSRRDLNSYEEAEEECQSKLGYESLRNIRGMGGVRAAMLC